jgi:hypothetical protein
MDSKKDWRWTFLVFETTDEERPVQEWFNGLHQVPKEEIADLLVYLQNVTTKPWKRPEFDPLKGAGGISEIRFRNISWSEGGVVKTATYRIYGFFGPKECKGSYTFLHANDKRVTNDRIGKGIARTRLDQLGRGEGRVREFNISTEPGPPTEPE